MENIFFFQRQQIPDSSSIFNQLKEQKIFYSYFQVDQNYYLFLFSQKPIDINFLYQSDEIIQELDSKQRKIRSLRGFFLYALEIIQNGDNYEILKTNLQPFFWKKVKDIIRQNKKSALQEFLFGKEKEASNPRIQILEDQIQNLQNQVDSLQEKIIQLKQNQTLEIKKTLNELLKASRDKKTIQEDESTLKTESPYLTSNDSKVNFEVKEPSHQISKSFSEAPRRGFLDPLNSGLGD